MVKEYTKEEIKKLIAENERLSLENKSMQKILRSKRFRAAEKIANTFNVVFPEHSPQRAALKGLYLPVKTIRKRRNESIAKKIEKLSKDFDKIVVMHSIPWNTPLKQRPQHLARCLSEKGIFVIYLEPDEPIHKFRKVSSSFVTTNNWETVFRLKLKEGSKYYFFFNNVSNIDFDIIEKIKNQGYDIVYEYIDEFHEDISGSMLNQLETWEKLPKLKPLVLASADKLYDEAKNHFRDCEIIMSKNAVVAEDFNYHNFTKIEPPDDLAPILKTKKPIIGYYGALAPWLDYKLISDSAKNNPDLNFVYLGVNYQNALQNLDQNIKNLHYLGPKRYTDLPKYSSFFDCAIIPFGTGEIAKGTSPVKLFEYMAMGLPTVGTRDLRECSGFKHVYLAKTTEEFSDLIHKAIEEKQDNTVRETLLSQAKANTWESRAEEISNVLKRR